MNFDWKGHASMFGANAMWGLLSPISKVIMASGAITPLVVTDLRIGGAMVLFWAASFFNKPEHVSHKDLATLFFASLLAIVFNQGCFVFGVSLTSPGDAYIITTSMPLWAMILAAFILKEPITGKKCQASRLAREAPYCSSWAEDKTSRRRPQTKTLQYGETYWCYSPNCVTPFTSCSIRILSANIRQ